MTGSALASVDQSFEDGFFTVRDGLRLHYRDYRPGHSSDRPPLLCLHGLTRNARDFAELATRVAQKRRVLVLEFRGRGDSQPDPVSSRYNPLTYAGDVIGLLDHLQLPHAVFLGTSLGGLVTMAVAALAPHRVAAAIINDVGPELEQVGLDRIMAYLGVDSRFASWEEAAKAISINQGASFPNYRADDWLAMARRNCREENGEIRFDYDMAIADPIRAAGPVPSVDLWPMFAALAQKPLLVIRGELSRLLNVETFARMQEVAPDARYVTVEGVGHSPDLTEPDAVAAIDRFLATLPTQLEPSHPAAKG